MTTKTVMYLQHNERKHRLCADSDDAAGVANAATNNSAGDDVGDGVGKTLRTTEEGPQPATSERGARASELGHQCFIIHAPSTCTPNSAVSLAKLQHGFAALRTP